MQGRKEGDSWYCKSTLQVGTPGSLADYSQQSRDVDLAPGHSGLQLQSSIGPGVIGRRNISDLGAIGDSLSPTLARENFAAQHEALELAYRHLPLPKDSERPKSYSPVLDVNSLLFSPLLPPSSSLHLVHASQSLYDNEDKFVILPLMVYGLFKVGKGYTICKHSSNVMSFCRSWNRRCTPFVSLACWPWWFPYIPFAAISSSYSCFLSANASTPYWQSCSLGTLGQGCSLLCILLPTGISLWVWKYWTSDQNYF